MLLQKIYNDKAVKAGQPRAQRSAHGEEASMQCDLRDMIMAWMRMEYGLPLRLAFRAMAIFLDLSLGIKAGQVFVG